MARSGDHCSIHQQPSTAMRRLLRASRRYGSASCRRAAASLKIPATRKTAARARAIARYFGAASTHDTPRAQIARSTTRARRRRSLRPRGVAAAIATQKSPPRRALAPKRWPSAITPSRAAAPQVPASINGADALARHVAASYRLKDAAVRLNWKGRPLARDAAVRTCLASQEPPVLEARLAQPRPTPAPHGPHSRAATAATQSGKRRRPVDDEDLRPTSRRRRATDDSLDSCSLSDGYPMSDYEDADEPLYAKPLLAAHKAPLVPSWARELSDDVLREQSAIDPLAVFVDPADNRWTCEPSWGGPGGAAAQGARAPGGVGRDVAVAVALRQRWGRAGRHLSRRAGGRHATVAVGRGRCGP